MKSPPSVNQGHWYALFSVDVPVPIRPSQCCFVNEGSWTEINSDEFCSKIAE